VPRHDVLHLSLLLFALAAAYLVPFELLLLAYVVLGPAHYFSEISWLHDRSYYLPHRGIAIGLVALVALAILTFNNSWLGFFAWSAFIACAMLAATVAVAEAVVVFISGVAFAALALWGGTSFALIGILLPTLVHVSVFTLIFMGLGAYRSRSKGQTLLIAIYVLAIALLLLAPPTADVRIPSFAEAAHEYFGGVATAIGELFGMPGLKLDNQVIGLLAFMYTYHYLNWFIKVDVIRWADIPKPRLVLMIAGSVGMTTLYFYSYAWGFILLLALSLAHVFLELPLNALSMRQLGGVAASELKAALCNRN
jgi:hypothetical protein